MNAPEAPALVDRSPAVGESSAATAWKICLFAIAFSCLALFLVYFETFHSMATTWFRSDTYVHGFFILPISLYLIWTKRTDVRKLVPRADARALVPILLVGSGWLAARLGGVLVAEQYFAVASIPLMVWVVAGPSVVRRLLFPLGYLLLMVPVGEVFIPFLIEHTATFIVAALRLSGVPVLRDGNILTLPNSQWSVVEACSGLRYLIACVTIGLVFAYLNYRNWMRRALFIGLSIAVPIVANWIRAYLIVMIGHTSDMQLAVGVDHLIYGWVFYAIVMCLLLWVGTWFSDHAAPSNEETLPESAKLHPTPIHRTVIVVCASVLAAAIWPVWAGYAESSAIGSTSAVSFAFPESLGDWKRAGRPSPWEPHYVGAGFTDGALYERGDSRVGFHVAIYAVQRQGAELVSSTNSFVAPEKDSWRQRRLEGRLVSLRGGSLTVDEAILAGPSQQLVVWRWYWISGRPTSSPAWAKIIEATERLRFRQPLSAGLIVFTPLDEEESARSRLTEFLEQGLPMIESTLAELSR